LKKKTHKEYVNELLANNIVIIPLEQYINNSTKILHKCECGNEYKVQPNVVLKGYKCGCTKIKEYNYLEKLKDKNIKIKPLEEYKGSRIKILHKCTCGNEWMTTPNSIFQGNKCGKCNEIEYKKLIVPLKIKIIGDYINRKTKIKHQCTCGNFWDVTPQRVLQGNRCGCKRNGHDDEVYKNRRTILYYILINDKIYKPGVAIWEKYKTPEETILKQRYGRDIKNNVKIKILNYYVFDDGIEALKMEKYIIEKYKEKLYYKTYNDMDWFGGYKELVTEKIIELEKENE